MDNDYEPPRQRKKPKVKESIIDHTYRDYSQVEVSSDEEGGSVTDDKKQSRLQPNFPAKLHAIVSNPNYQHIVCWQAHGRSWKIVDKHLLSTVICPKHFAHAKFESFNRSVNGWGFKRLLNPGPDCKSYYHECFLRGRPELTKLMQRLVNPGKRLPDKAGEPDFYEISRKYPLPAAPTTALQEELIPSAMSPHDQRPSQQSRFTFPPNQPGGYPYGYYPAPYPQLPSPASSYAGQQPYPPQPTQQGFYQMPPTIYPPNPAAYGYYPYPQMMMPQGYEQYPHPSVYGQYYPGGPGTPTASYAAASPGRSKTASQTQPPQVDEQGQYYQSPGAQPDSSATNDVDPDEDRKPSAITGVKRPLESLHGGPADSYPSEPPPHAAGTSAKDGAYTSSEQPTAGVMSSASAKASSEGSSTVPERRLTKPEEGSGDGINEQQLLQDFFQHF